MSSTRLRGHDLEIDHAQDEVGHEQEEEGDDDRLVHRVTDTLRTAAGVHALVGGHDRGDQTEDQRFDQTDVEVGQLGQGGEAGEIGTGVPSWRMTLKT